MTDHWRKPHNVEEADMEVTFSHPWFYIYIQHVICFLRSSPAGSAPTLIFRSLTLEATNLEGRKKELKCPAMIFKCLCTARNGIKLKERAAFQWDIYLHCVSNTYIVANRPIR